jgi:hypothetical protein
MGFPSMHADVTDRRIENNAAVVDPYQPSLNLSRRAPPESPKLVVDATKPRRSCWCEVLRFELVVKLASEPNPERFSLDLLSETFHWLPDRFDFLGRRSPNVLARVAMSYRDIASGSCTQ